MSKITIDLNVIVRKEHNNVFLEYKTYRRIFESLFNSHDSGEELYGHEDALCSLVADSKYNDGYYEIYGEADVIYTFDYYGECGSEIDPDKLNIIQYSIKDKDDLVTFLDEELNESLLPETVENKVDFIEMKIESK